MTTKKCLAPSIFTVSLGSKGQIVIPKEVRDMLQVIPGDKLMLMAKDDHFMCLPADHMQQFINLIQEQLQQK